MKSEDLLLNISRVTETLVEKNCLGEFAGCAGKKNNCEKFYERFGKRLKVGNHEDSTHRTKLAELWQFGAPKSGDELIRLRDCVGRRKERQHVHLQVSVNTCLR